MSSFENNFTLSLKKRATHLTFRRMERNVAIVSIHSRVLRSLIVSSAFSLNQRLELNDSRNCKQPWKWKQTRTHKRARYHWWWSEYPPLVGIYTRNLDQANSNHFVPILVFLFLDERTSRCTRGRREEKYLCAPFAREMGALRDALAVGKDEVERKERANDDEETFLKIRWWEIK